MQRAFTFLALLLGTASGPLALATAPDPLPAPEIPPTTAAQERALLQDAARLLSRARFDEAAAALRPLSPPASAAVFVDWTPVPRARRLSYRQAAAAALQAWNTALQRPDRFRWADREEDADLLILFEKAVAVREGDQVLLSCQDLRLEPGSVSSSPPRRTARLRLAYCIPHSEAPHSPESIEHLVGQGLGAYLGLGPSAEPEDIMGPDTHSDSVSRAPAARDLAALRAVEAARAQLLDYALRRQEVRGSAPAIAVEKLELDAGEVWRGDTPHFVFTLRNTGDKPLEIRAKPNCDCVVPRYDATISPGGLGKVEAELHTNGQRGPVTRLIEVSSNDPERPVVLLRLTARVKSLLSVLPGEAPLIPLRDRAPTVHELQIRIAGKEPIELREPVCGVAFASAQVELLPQQPGQDRTYRLTLTVSPEAPEGRSVFPVSLTTNSVREPNLVVTVTCEKGIVVAPPSLFMGVVRPAPAAPVTRLVVLQKRTAPFHLRKVSCSDPKLEVEQQAGSDASEYRLVLTYRGGWTAGSIRAVVTVETDDPTRPRIEIPVLATVAMESPQ